MQAIIDRATLISMVLICAVLSGCASFTPKELADLDYGHYPFDYKEIIQQHLNRSLKDPASAILDYRGSPATVWQKGSIFGSRDYGWGVCVFINAKNSYGGYVGERPYFFLIRDGKIIRTYGEMETNLFDTALAQGGCKRVGG